MLYAKTDEELDKISITSAALNPASLTQVTKPKEKLIIFEKKDYPITKNFPSSLTELKGWYFMYSFNVLLKFLKTLFSNIQFFETLNTQPEDRNIFFLLE